MIFDATPSASLYFNAHPRFERAFRAIEGFDLANLAEGRYQIDGDDIYFMIMERDLKEAPLLEVHDKYIDIQIVIAGNESQGWKPRAECQKPQGEIDTQKDILFYDDPYQTTIDLLPGQFTIFFPQDAHAPCQGNGHVKKAVVKVRV